MITFDRAALLVEELVLGGGGGGAPLDDLGGHGGLRGVDQRLLAKRVGGHGYLLRDVLASLSHRQPEALALKSFAETVRGEEFNQLPLKIIVSLETGGAYWIVALRCYQMLGSFRPYLG